jgi:hypothetical protein
MPEESGGQVGSADVKIRLIVDNGAEDTIRKMKESMGGASSEIEKAKGHASGLSMEVFKGNTYFAIAHKSAELIATGFEQAFEMTVKFAEAATEAADEMNQQVRSLSGLMGLMDRGQHSMEGITEYAKEMREDLEKIGIQAGMTTKEVTEMYQAIIERGNISTEKAYDLTQQMALVGKVVPGGTRGLAEGFSMMELGIVRARNPLVQLIAATGQLHGNAHAVAAQMQKMSPEKQLEAARAAIEKQYEVLSKGGGGAMLTPTLGELNKSFATMRESFLESIGQPMLDALIPKLVELRNFLSSNAEAIKDFGAMVGRDLGKTIGAIDAALEGIYAGVTKNWGEVQSLFHEILGDWGDGWSEALGDTKTIKATFESMTKDLIEAFRTIVHYVNAAYEVFENIHDLAYGGAGNAAEKRLSGNAAGEVSKKADEIGSGSSAALDEAIRKYRILAAEAGASAVSVDDWTTKMREHHALMEQEGSALQDKVETGDTDYIGNFINQAIAGQNEGAEKFAFAMIADSDAMTKALMDGSIHVSGGFDALRQVIEEKAPELADKMRNMGKSSVPKDIKGSGPSIVMNGGQTFHIKQDFREADPDRVIVRFRRDLVAHAENRRQSRVGTPFGL